MPAMQTLLAEVEDVSSKVTCHDSELQIITERLDEQDSKIQRLSANTTEDIAKKLQKLEQDYKVLAKIVTRLTSSIQETQTSTLKRYEDVQKDFKALSQDIRLLRRSLLALVNGSSEAYPDFSDNVPSHIHIVQPGETLGKIAAKYNISVTELKKINKLTSDVIYADQKLCLPENKR